MDAEMIQVMNDLIVHDLGCFLGCVAAIAFFLKVIFNLVDDLSFRSRVKYIHQIMESRDERNSKNE